MAITADFADYCCELLSSLGPCKPKRMFGGWGISAEGCARFTDDVKGKLMGMNYYAAPADAMESPALMTPWARMALQAAPGLPKAG